MPTHTSLRLEGYVWRRQSSRHLGSRVHTTPLGLIYKWGILTLKRHRDYSTFYLYMANVMVFASSQQVLRVTSHMRPSARDHNTSSTLIGGKGRAGQVRFTLCLRDQQSKWMQDGCEVYMDSYMASNGSCFMVTWTTFENHLLEVGLT